MTIFLVIYKAENFTAEIEYIPLENGVIDIVSFHVQAHPISPFAQRQAERRKGRRGIAWDEGTEQAEAMQPYTLLEQMELF